MSHLLYKTRGMTTPQNKVRVYFCSHPEDHERYFEEIVGEILSKQNCVIWYNAKPYDAYDDNFFSDLETMQLFVIPITTKFLCSDNDAYNKEFKFAIEKHIPILPIMMESGLIDIFNFKCGELQFLDKTVQKNKFSESYEDKLEKHLISRIAGDELVEKIRSAFDAYIFLSYRKMDRRYALELMRLIHENEFCRKFAIWYDEYLIPGENFNDTIKDAIEKSDLFVLAVTPNIVDDPNYIISCEYPFAMNANKPVVPVELVNTDRETLSEKYKNIPECTNAADKMQLWRILSENIKSIALTKSEESPEHNFFLGLAYLSGVDVEINYKYALKLITSAAEAGLEEAVSKLVSMYINGDGVEKDLKKAVLWQKKLAKILKNKIKTYSDIKDLSKWVKELSQIGDIFYSMGQMKNAKDIYLQTAVLMEDITVRFADEQVKQYFYNIFRKLGDVYASEEDYDEAEKYYQRSFNAAYVEHGTENKMNSTDVFMSFDNLGRIFLEKGDFEKSKKYYNDSYRILRGLAKVADAEDFRNDFSACYSNLGNVCKAEGDYDEARKYYDKALKINKELVRELKTDFDLRQLSLTYVRIGDLLFEQAKYKDSLEYYGQALKITEDIQERTGTIESKGELALLYERMGDSNYRMEEYDYAGEYYDKEYKITKYIVSVTDSVKSRRAHALCCVRKGDIQAKDYETDKALNYYEKALRVNERLLNKYTNIDLYNDLTYNYTKVAGMRFAKKEYDTARELYLKAIEFAQMVYEMKKTEETKEKIATCLFNIGFYFKERSFLERACKIYLELSEHAPENSEYKEKVNAYKSLMADMFE